jgi:hypothetical protein
MRPEFDTLEVVIANGTAALRQCPEGTHSRSPLIPSPPTPSVSP